MKRGLKIRYELSVLSISILLISAASAQQPDRFVEMPAEVLRDKVHGGLLGQLFGNLNGLKYEFKFNEKPGNVQGYTPDLSEGARTDDDTDIEWIYIVEMQRSKQLLIPYPRLTELWKKHINRKIWVANRAARDLMHLDIQPPLTGSPLLNDKSHYNISGMFVCECFGLIAPGLPQTVDPESQIHEIVTTTRKWCRQHPADWRKTRRLAHEKYFSYPGKGNGYGVITAAIVASLIYGKGGLAETLRLAFNFGWDADNSATAAGTIIGVIKGRKWMEKQGWKIKDVYRIRVQKPVNIEPMVSLKEKSNRLKAGLIPKIQKDFKSDDPSLRMRATFLAVRLGLSEDLRKLNPKAFDRAHSELIAKLMKESRRKKPAGKRTKLARMASRLLQALK